MMNSYTSYGIMMLFVGFTVVNLFMFLNKNQNENINFRIEKDLIKYHSQQNQKQQQQFKGAEEVSMVNKTMVLLYSLVDKIKNATFHSHQSTTNSIDNDMVDKIVRNKTTTMLNRILGNYLPKWAVSSPEIEDLEWLDREDAKGFADYGDKTCPVTTDRKPWQKVLTKWIEIAKKHKIRYFLTSGTLLGARRD